ncbi:MAG: type IV secretion protein Rhs, partial [Cytophagales bacterium]
MISQENHYYAFGLNAKEIEKEGSNRFQFMGVEKESSFGLDWIETDHRSYDGEVGRFWQVDKLSEDFDSATPYNYAFNNPILLNDPEGLAPPNFEEFLKGLFASSKNGAVYSGDEVRSAFAKTQGLKEEETVSFAQGSNNNKSGIWVDIEGTKNSGLTARGKKSS